MALGMDAIRTIAGRHGLAIDDPIAELLQLDSAIGIGVSGGKDSDATALAMVPFLREIGHAGPCVLIHADLGEIEHKDSQKQCKLLADHLGLELIVVRRPKGGMIERWEQRWDDNVARYVDLLCVTLITPWSSSVLRFCTSELKVSPITRELATKFHGWPIINVVGLRREESTERAAKPISQHNQKLYRSGGLGGRDYYPIIEWKLKDVWAIHRRHSFREHYAYIVNGNTRVSCSFCVLAGMQDHLASLNDERNHQAYLRVVDLELESSFSFQNNRWLADVRPELLSIEQRMEIERAKEIARHRREIEKRIPPEMRFVGKWPTFVPSLEQCALLAEVRTEIGALTGLPVRFITAETVRERYQELFELQRLKGGRAIG